MPSRSDAQQGRADAKCRLAETLRNSQRLELQELRDGLLQQGLDSWQAADLISSFLAGRGYGVSRQSARDAVLRADGISQSIDGMQAELEKLAMVM